MLHGLSVYDHIVLDASSVGEGTASISVKISYKTKEIDHD